MENIVSNDVYEWEIEQVTKQIVEYQSKKKPPPEDLVDRKQHLEMNMNLLGINVQTGKLTGLCQRNDGKVMMNRGSLFATNEKQNGRRKTNCKVVPWDGQK